LKLDNKLGYTYATKSFEPILLGIQF